MKNRAMKALSIGTCVALAAIAGAAVGSSCGNDEQAPFGEKYSATGNEQIVRQPCATPSPAPPPIERVGPVERPPIVHDPPKTTTDKSTPREAAPPAPELTAKSAPPNIEVERPMKAAEVETNKPATAPSIPRGELAIVSSSIATAIEARAPQGTAETFNKDVGAVWAWVKVRNKAGLRHITMLWKKGDKVKSRVTLRVGKSPGWRTWSKKRISGRDVGSWTVEVQDEDGGLLETMAFEVTPVVAQ